MKNTLYSSRSQYPKKQGDTPTRNGTIPAEAYKKVARVFHVAKREHFVLWFKGHTGRDRRTEVLLKRLADRGELRRKRHGKPFVYWSPDNWRTEPAHVEHGLMCTEALVRFFLAKRGIPIRERSFKGMKFHVVPEWGMDYDGSLLLFEYGTEDNFYYTPRKITAYKKNLYKLEYAFTGHAVVLFVLDAERKHLKRYLESRMPIGGEFYFCDTETFLSVPYGDQLTADIYIWGGDGNTYPLSQHD